MLKVVILAVVLGFIGNVALDSVSATIHTHAAELAAI